MEGVSNNISSLPGGSDGIVRGYRGQIATNDLEGATHYFFKLLFTLLGCITTPGQHRDSKHTCRHDCAHADEVQMQREYII